MFKRITAQHMVDKLDDQGWKGRPPLTETESEIMGLFASDLWDRFPEALDILDEAVRTYNETQDEKLSLELTDGTECEGNA